jgi:hypothetical protein
VVYHESKVIIRENKDYPHVVNFVI